VYGDLKPTTRPLIGEEKPFLILGPPRKTSIGFANGGHDAPHMRSQPGMFVHDVPPALFGENDSSSVRVEGCREHASMLGRLRTIDN
jgi:hypothetical protein